MENHQGEFRWLVVVDSGDSSSRSEQDRLVRLRQVADVSSPIRTRSSPLCRSGFAPGVEYLSGFGLDSHDDAARV